MRKVLWKVLLIIFYCAVEIESILITIKIFWNRPDTNEYGNNETRPYSNLERRIFRYSYLIVGFILFYYFYLK